MDAAWGFDGSVASMLATGLFVRCIVAVLDQMCKMAMIVLE
jgi:hypothetical protein